MATESGRTATVRVHAFRENLGLAVMADGTVYLSPEAAGDLGRALIIFEETGSLYGFDRSGSVTVPAAKDASEI